MSVSEVKNFNKQYVYICNGYGMLKSINSRSYAEQGFFYMSLPKID